MHLRGALRWVVLMLVLAGMSGWAAAGEAPKKEGDTPKKEADTPKKEADTPKKAEEPKKKAGEPTPENVVGKVDDVLITRDDLKLAQRQIMAINRQAPPLNNQQLLEQLIERVLWMRYFEKQGLRASGAEIQRAIQQLDAELRQRGTSYQRWIAAMGLTAEEHASLIAFDLASARLRQRLQSDIQEEDVKKEFEAHPEFYDGSRVRISQIFIETADIQHDPAKLKKAKERIDKIHDELRGDKDFERLARDYSERVTSLRGGEEGWFVRKGLEENEPLLAAAWALKAGEYTKPIQGSRGWHIVKVTDREPAYLTPFGARRNVIAELLRRRVAAILDELKAKADIERRL
ncbi:MAG TPA: peptidylprolyl isomerase [Planctomycetota bacterium]|nr:peptidylprolyl isomerase [Planctomycetota bacterium]